MRNNRTEIKMRDKKEFPVTFSYRFSRVYLTDIFLYKVNKIKV
jgi:hypothetical protein